MFAGRVCRSVTLGREQPGSPTPLLHCEEKELEMGVACLWTWCNVHYVSIAYHINDCFYMRLIQSVLCLHILSGLPNSLWLTRSTGFTCISQGWQVYHYKHVQHTTKNLIMQHYNIMDDYFLMEKASLMPSKCVPPSKKPYGEQSRISWAYSWKVVRTNEVVRSVIIM